MINNPNLIDKNKRLKKKHSELSLEIERLKEKKRSFSSSKLRQLNFSGRKPRLTLKKNIENEIITKNKSFKSNKKLFDN
jgi:hypothetical protein